MIQSLSIIIPQEYIMTYLSISVFLIGVLAMIFQKKLDKDKIKDMGFHLNRNVGIGFIISITFIILTFLLVWIIPIGLGWIELENNIDSPIYGTKIDAFTYIVFLFLTDGVLMFIAALFGEELAFRGYIQPKIEEKSGIRKAILYSAVIFAFWHLPVYFSLYRNGGVLEQGGFAIGFMIYLHFISVIPLAILYNQSKELYGVSYIHAVFDMVTYYIIGNAALGDASSKAIYTLSILNDLIYQLYVIMIDFVLIFLMLILCKITKRFIENPKKKQIEISENNLEITVNH